MFFVSSEHNPPHFHAYYGDYSAVFAIETFEVLKGRLPPRIKGLVIEWSEIHKEELEKNWELLKKDKFNKIEPLV